MKGVIAATPTPVDGDGNFKEFLFIEHARWALANGCDGLNVLGSTGEANTFGTQARKAIMECAVRNLPIDRLMVGTGTPSLSETIELTLFAADLGFPVALVLPPYYYKPVSNAGIADWYNRLDREIGSRKLKIYFYNFPQMTGINLPVDLIADLHRKNPQRFAGIKDSSGDLGYCSELVAAAPDLKVFPSSETSLWQAAEKGYSGCISATVNITAPICQRVWSSSTADPKDVRAIDEQRRVISATPLIPSIKYLVGQQSQNPAWDNVLPPFQSLSDEQKAALISAIAETNGQLAC